MKTLKHRFISVLFVILCRRFWGISTPLSLSRRD